MMARIGDKVRLVRGKDTPPDEVLLGTTGVIEDTDGDSMPYRVRRDADGNANWYYHDEIELVGFHPDTGDANTTILEGVVEDTTCGVAVGGMALKYELRTGDHVRIIIERTAKEAR